MKSPEEAAADLNAHLGGFSAAIGLRFLRASPDEVVAELDVTAAHHQPHGIVHGGVHASVVETLASTGAGLFAETRGLTVVGLENRTTFVHAVRDGTLTATARPLTRGRRTQVWEVRIEQAGRVAATGSVRLLCLEPDAQLAGKPAVHQS